MHVAGQDEVPFNLCQSRLIPTFASRAMANDQCLDSTEREQ